MKKKKHPADINKLAKSIVDLATDENPPEEDSKKNPHFVALGRLGGKKGGKARKDAGEIEVIMEGAGRSPAIYKKTDKYVKQ